MVQSSLEMGQPLYASEMECGVKKLDGQWTLTCFDVLLSTLVFDERADCRVVDGLRLCSTPISLPIPPQGSH